MNNDATERLREQTLSGHVPAAAEWSEQLKAIYAAGKGLHETLAYLHEHRPSADAFAEWMQSVSSEIGMCAEDVLTEKDLAFFRQNGYLILKNAVSPDECGRARNAVSEYLGIDINDPSSWYELKNRNHGLMVPLYQHEALHANRHSARIRKAFEQLYGSSAIHPVIEKVSFNPPETAHYHFAGSPLHWDASLAQPIPFKLQGLLYLSDCETDGGAFHCVPGFHHNIGEWLNNLPENTDPRSYATETLTSTAVPGKTGDLVIWHQALPHCATANKSSAPRFVQYITYDPDGYIQQEKWI